MFDVLLTSFFLFGLCQTACADFFGGDILFRIYCVKLSIGIFHIIRVVVKERFEMMRGLWRGMLVSFFSFFFFSFFFFNYHKTLFFSNSQTKQLLTMI